MQKEKKGKFFIVISIVLTILISVVVKKGIDNYRNDKLMSKPFTINNQEDIIVDSIMVSEFKKLELNYLEKYLIKIKDTIMFHEKYNNIKYDAIHQKYISEINPNKLEKHYLDGLSVEIFNFMKKNKIKAIKLEILLPESLSDYFLHPPGVYYGNDEFGILPSELDR